MSVADAGVTVQPSATDTFSTCAVGRSKEHPTRLPHSQNPRLRAFASACASAFCSFGSGLLIQCLACIAINGMQTGHWIATAQVALFCIIGCADSTPAFVTGLESESLYGMKRRVNYHEKENQSDHAWL